MKWICDVCGRKAPGQEGMIRCARCFSVRYCTPECQAKDWPWHRDVCRHWLAFNLGHIPNAIASVIQHAMDPVQPLPRRFRPWDHLLDLSLPPTPEAQPLHSEAQPPISSCSAAADTPQIPVHEASGGSAAHARSNPAPTPETLRGRDKKLHRDRARRALSPENLPRGVPNPTTPASTQEPKRYIPGDDPPLRVPTPAVRAFLREFERLYLQLDIDEKLLAAAVRAMELEAEPSPLQDVRALILTQWILIFEAGRCGEPPGEADDPRPRSDYEKMASDARTTRELIGNDYQDLPQPTIGAYSRAHGPTQWGSASPSRGSASRASIRTRSVDALASRGIQPRGTPAFVQGPGGFPRISGFSTAAQPPASSRSPSRSRRARFAEVAIQTDSDATTTSEIVEKRLDKGLKPGLKNRKLSPAKLDLRQFSPARRRLSPSMRDCPILPVTTPQDHVGAIAHEADGSANCAEAQPLASCSSAAATTPQTPVHEALGGSALHPRTVLPPVFEHRRSASPYYRQQLVPPDEARPPTNSPGRTTGTGRGSAPSASYSWWHGSHSWHASGWWHGYDEAPAFPGSAQVPASQDETAAAQGSAPAAPGSPPGLFWTHVKSSKPNQRQRRQARDAKEKEEDRPRWQ